MKQILRFLVVVFLLLTGAACSSVPQRVAEQKTPFQTILVNTPGVTGADCIMESNDRNYRVKAPGTIMVHRSPWPLTISCYKGNYMKGVDRFSASYAPRDGEEALAKGSDCVTCSYPNIVSVAMALDPNALQHEIQIFR